MVDPSDGLDGLDGPDPGEEGRPDATEVELVPVGEEPRLPAPLASVNRRHAGMAAAVVLASAIFISRAGEAVPTAVALRTTDFSGPELTTADDEDEAEDVDDDQRYRVPSWLEDEDVEAYPYDDELAMGDEDITINTFDSFEDFEDFNDDFTSNTLPRSASSPRPTRPGNSSSNASRAGSGSNTARNTTTTSTTTPVADTTTTAATTTTTVAPTTPTSPATSTPVPVAKWESASAGLACVAPLGVWVRNDLLVASAGAKLFTTTDAGQTWSERHRADGLAVVPLAALQQHPAVRDQFWVATVDGVFEAADSRAPLVELGNLAGVRSLGIDDSNASGIALFAVADPGATLYRWTPANPTWEALAAPLSAGTVPGDVAVLGGRVFLGTDRGVFQLAQDESWIPRSQQAVKGAPVIANGVSYWLLADGGVLRNDGGENWVPASTGALSPRPNGSAGLTHTPGRDLVTTGGSGLVVSTDGGTSWKAFDPAPEFAPTGVSYSPADEATFAWRSDCAAGSVPANAIMKLADATS